jgi:gas vesicle structural protein
VNKSKHKKEAMGIEPESRTPSLIDVLDRVLDKGIVIDAWVRLSLVGIQLLNVETRVFVASIETYLRYADVMRDSPLVSAPGGRPLASRSMFPVDAPSTAAVARPP